MYEWLYDGNARENFWELKKLQEAAEKLKWATGVGKV